MDIKQKIENLIGCDPYVKMLHRDFEKEIQIDYEASEYYRKYRLPSGEPLSEKKQIEYLTKAQILNTIVRKTSVRTRLTKAKLWQQISEDINTLDKLRFPHNLPSNPRSLQRVTKKYKTEGYESLVHKGFGNANTRKITQDVGEWLIAMYALPIKMSIPEIHTIYNQRRKEKGWCKISESAIKAFIFTPENEKIWTVGRHGKSVYRADFGHKMKKDKSQWFPNCWWAIDGTKLDWVHYYDNTIKMAAKLKIDPVIDVFSEKILGYSYSETEDHTDHFKAIKMAVNNSHARPYLFTHDRQSAHTSARMQELYKNLVARQGGTTYPHKARRHSNPVEQIFLRFQKQVLNKMWFSDKQSVTSKTHDSRPNMEFISENKHHLKSKEELLAAFEFCVNKWNSMKHPHFEMSRDEVYQQEAPMSESISFSDQIQMFWIEETTPLPYRQDGIRLTVNKKKYLFEVYDNDGKVDTDFRFKNVGAKLIIRYDPQELDNFVQLYKLNSKGEKVFVATAEPKRGHESIPVLMEEGAKALIMQDEAVQDIEYQRDSQKLEEIRKRTGVTPENLIEEQELMIKLGGSAPKYERSIAESESFLDQL
ncbi:hypothetical protein EZY14_016435 [Kordia sp. TARA_039_SRF]|nr:hypothetical protein EZY14_016435 [Kordia sp. TARA_039_SRF]